MMLILEKGFHEDCGGRGGRISWGWGGGGRRAWGLKTDIYIDMGSFEIGQRLEIFIFRGVG